MTATSRRRGVTLAEVLIATGILAIGLTAILALFPIGAVNMARAINQNRSAQHGANSDSVFRFIWKQTWLDSSSRNFYSDSQAAFNASGEPMLDALEVHPLYLQSSQPPIVPPPPFIPRDSSQAGFPVLVDPIGWNTQGVNQAFIAGDQRLPRRVTLRAAELDPMRTRTIVRLTTLLDDMTFDSNTGEPATATGQLERGGRYNVAWLIQRPKHNVPTEVNVTVLVYAGRSPTDTPSQELVYDAAIFGYDPRFSAVMPKQIVINNGGPDKPPVKTGGWIAFTTRVQPPFGVPYPSLDFYRVTGTTEDPATPGFLLVDIETAARVYDVNPLPAPRLPEWTPNGPTGQPTLNGRVIVFDNLVEVFDRGTTSASGTLGR
jgi:hypothetical protein